MPRRARWLQHDIVKAVLIVAMASTCPSRADETDKTPIKPAAVPVTSAAHLARPSVNNVQPHSANPAGRLGSVFIENCGQFPDQVKYQLQSGTRTLWLTARGVVIDLPDEHSSPPDSHSALRRVTERSQIDSRGNERRVAVYEEFIGGTKNPEIEAKLRQPGIYNFMVSPDSTKWRSNVRGYAEVVYRNVWDGIDFRLHGNGPNLEQEFVVAPGADLNRVQIAYSGIEELKVDVDGSLVINTTSGKIRETPPTVYQEIKGERVPIKARFKATSRSSFAFQVDRYDGDYALVIDPTLLYSTYLGATSPSWLGVQYADAIAVDSSGNAYVTGVTVYTNFPTTTGAFETTTGGASTFVTKISPLGDHLIYSTYLNGASLGIFYQGIAVDASGDAYVTGSAGGGFPTTNNAFQSTCGGAFLTVLNPGGTGLIYSTCFGGGTVGIGIAVDSSGLAYMTGAWTSPFTPLPTTPSAAQPNPGANAPDAFIAVLNPASSGSASLIYSTYLGGSGADYGNAITVDSFGNVYVTGYTMSSDFPITPGAYQNTFYGYPCDQGPCKSAFVTKLNPNVSGPAGLIYSTYISGSSNSNSSGIAVDLSGNAYIVGTTGYGGPMTPFVPFPTTSGALVACSDSFGLDSWLFVTKLNAAGNALVYSTCIGAGANNTGPGIAIDSNGDAFLTGSTHSTTFPVTNNAYQRTWYGGGTGEDGFVTELSPTGSGLVYSSFLGGSGGDTLPYAIAVDAVGDAYITGGTSSDAFPTTESAYQPVQPVPTGANAGTNSAFIAKFPLGAPQALSILGVEPSVGGNAGTVTAQIVGAGFHLGATATLACSAQASISGTNLSVGVGGRSINTTFDLTTAMPGSCTLAVTNPDGTSVILAQGFTVQQGGAPNLWFDLVGRNQLQFTEDIRSFSTAELYLTAGNSGSADWSGLAFTAIKVPVGLDPVEIYLDNNLVGQFHPEALSSLPGEVNPGNSALVGTFVFPRIPPLGHSVYTVQFTPPASLQGSSVFPVEFDTFEAPIFTPTGTDAIGSYLLNLIELKGQELGISPPSLSQAFVQAFSKALEDACEDVGLELDQMASDASLPKWLRKVVNTAIKILNNPTLNNQLTAFQDFFNTVITGQNGNFFDSALYANYQQLQPPFQPYKLPFFLENIGVVSSFDPNDKVGSAGFGGQEWVATTRPLQYAVNFGNDPTATAPAAAVQITDQLNLATDDPTTFQLGLITFMNYSLIPRVGSSNFSTTVDLRPTTSLLVNVTAQLNSANGLVTWNFQSIDPSTMQPPTDPEIGFLPPGGSGSVYFTVNPKSNVTTGTSISNQATVVFDNNPPMNTATWTNTIDDSPPTSHVSALPATSTCPDFRVSWAGNDVGSGLKSFTIYASDTGEPFAPWISNTVGTSTTYKGKEGHSYSFYSIATDNVGNVEGTKTLAEASTSVTAVGPCGPPSLRGRVTAVSQSGTTVTVILKLTNVGFKPATTVDLNQIAFQTLSGSGTVTLSSPTLPDGLGRLGVDGSTDVTLTLSVPSTVTKFSMNERGTLTDHSGTSYKFSLKQAVTP